MIFLKYFCQFFFDAIDILKNNTWIMILSSVVKLGDVRGWGTTTGQPVLGPVPLGLWLPGLVTIETSVATLVTP